MISATDFAKAIEEMTAKKLFKELMILLDTCEASTMYENVEYSANTILIGTSILEEHALSHQADPSLNVFLNDKFSFFFVDYLKNGKLKRDTSVADLVKILNYGVVESHVTSINMFKEKKESEIKIGDFLPFYKHVPQVKYATWEDLKAEPLIN